MMQQILLGYTTATSSGGSGDGAVIFDGSGDWLEAAKSTDYDFGGRFTMEAWVYANSLTTGNDVYQDLDCIFESIDWNSQNGQYSFGISHENKPYFYIFDGNNTFIYGNTVLSTHTWYHLLVSRDSSGGIRFFVNGSFDGSGSNNYSLSNSNQPNPARIGGAKIYNSGAGVQRSFDGYISNVRIINGTTLYTSSFTLPGLPLTETSQGATNVKLLCCKDPQDAVGSTVTPTTITALGDPQPSTQSPFDTNNGVWIDRSDNQYLYTLNDSGIQFGTGDFTVECWFRWHSNNSGWQSIFGKYAASGGAAGDNGFWLHLNNGGILTGGDRGNGFANGSTALNLHEWYHTALVRSGTTVSIYLNGVLEASHTSDDGGGVPRNCDNNTEFAIGYLSNYGRGWDGDISNLRCVKGQALYTGNFTPPTSPLTLTSQGAIESNVGFLGCQTPIVSAVAKGPAINTNGYVKPSYGPFSGSSGFGSVDLDGSNDFVEVAAVSGNNPPWSFGSNDAFTIECWAYADSYANTGWYKRIWSLSDNPAVNNYTDGITMEMDNGGSFRFRHDNNIYLSSGSKSASTWYHVAFTRLEEGSIVLHVDGQAQQTANNPGTMDYGPHSVKIGEHHGLNQSGWNGKISNFHIHKGAKYPIGDFTKPTTPVGPSANTIILCCTDPSNATSSIKTPSTITTGGNASASSSHPF